MKRHIKWIYKRTVVFLSISILYTKPWISTKESIIWNTCISILQQAVGTTLDILHYITIHNEEFVIATNKGRHTKLITKLQHWDLEIKKLSKTRYTHNHRPKIKTFAWQDTHDNERKVMKSP